MKRIWTALLAAILLIPMTFQSQAQAAVNISVLIDGVKLYTPQAPIMIQGRVMLPMRSIFEALDASVKWNQKTKTVTATKNGTTVILKINSKTATINNKTVALDVPAKNLKGNTMVPVRFVSEALGQKIGWNSKTKTVTVKTTNNSGGGGNNTGIVPVNYVTLRDIGNAGDGRDLQVSFSKSSTESLISHYRVMIVKQSKTLNQSEAQRVSSAAYTSVYPSGSDQTLTLTSGSRDVDNDLIRDNQSYKAYVLAVSNTGGTYALSSASPSLTLTNTNSVNGATNVKASDVSDYGDGRDLQVSFTRAQNESNVTNYRVFAVKTKDVANFNLAAAKSVPSQNYTTVSKTSTTNTTLSTTLSSSARDTSNELIRSGVAYTVFVLSVSSNESVLASNLSSGSSSITLNTGTATVPSITQVTDISDYGDGRDLRVSFNKVSNESNIHSYRVFVVKDSNYSSFNLSKANAVSSYNYTLVNKTGNNINNLTLASGARDVDGATIRNGVYYRVFVMAVDYNNSNNNVLSAPSSSIILSSSTNLGAVTNLSVTDVNNYNDGRDLQVSFTQPSDRSNISYYQVFVVKSSDSYFDLNRANNLNNSNYYTQINKNNNSNYITQTLNSNSRDIDGELIRNGVSYRVYVLSVGYSGGNNNALSNYSSITLGNNNQGNVNPVSTPTLSINGNNGNGSDLKVSFNPANGENFIDHYRILVVKSSMSLTVSQAYDNKNFTTVYKTGGTITRDLTNTTRDSDGDLIQRGSSYRVYVLSVGYSNYGRALSSVSRDVTIQGVTEVGKATNVTAAVVGNEGNGSDLKVTFSHASGEGNIDHYRIFAVKSSKNLTLSQAQSNSYYTQVYKANSYSQNLGADARDTDGELIRNDQGYRVYVLSVSNRSSNYSDALSAPSGEIKLQGVSQVGEANNVRVIDDGDRGNASDLKVSFTKSANEQNISQYRIIVVNESDLSKFNLDVANGLAAESYLTVFPGANYNDKLIDGTLDAFGKQIVNQQTYRVFVLSVSNNRNIKNKLSEASNSVTLKNETPMEIPSTVKAEIVSGNGNASDVAVKFKGSTTGIKEYRIMVVPSDKDKILILKDAEAITDSSQYTVVKPVKSEIVQKLTNLKDVNNVPISEGKEYKVNVLVVADGKTQNSNGLSPASENFTIPAPLQTSAVKASLNKDGKLQVDFTKAINEASIKHYRLLFVPKEEITTFDLPKATKAAAVENAKATITPKGKDISEIIDIDAVNQVIQSDTEFAVFVLSELKDQTSVQTTTLLSKPSNILKLPTKTP
ncbi:MULTISPECIES: copper amine oxidase N-terminal domain-containing protein [Paenibacillus]|uniref:Copper amine oxidase n=1 Tax=Paenibacillus lautus TaxID=1401 RepID=A0A1R1B2C7_PAELA|nr:copper amine oxidase N-terminal domain-containing protein [Paenibacillus lautus]OME92937.1 copper amine oxidase [Paenibacillus lautus]